MRKGINLTSEQKKANGVLKSIFYVSTAFFAVTVIVAIVLIAYRLFLSISLSDVTKKEEGVNAQLLQLQTKKDKFLETHSRLKDIKNILSKRSTITLKVSDLAQVVSNDASILSINGSDKEISLGVESGSLETLNDLIEQKVNQVASDKKKGVKKIEMKSFRLNPKTLLYQVDFAVTFK
jgi:hypothetical protein